MWLCSSASTRNPRQAKQTSLHELDPLNYSGDAQGMLDVHCWEVDALACLPPSCLLPPDTFCVKQEFVPKFVYAGLYLFKIIYHLIVDKT